MPCALSIPDLLRRQAGWCEKLGSPLYADVLNRSAADYESGGPLRDLLQPFEADAESTVLPLRLMGAVHRLVLEGKAASLATFYPSVGGQAGSEVWPAFRATIAHQMDNLRPLVNRPVQTNEVGRSGSLLPGFAFVADRTHLPLRLLEIGASAGLNLRWDSYRYEWPSGAWGDRNSGVCLKDIFVGPAPTLPSAIPVSSRAGCDLSPIDPTTAEGRLTLLSYVWCDQATRIAQLEAAICIAAVVPCVIHRASAADWLLQQLETPFPGVATVVFHSVVWQYLPDAEKEKVTRIIEEAGRRASAQAPLAWLRMEPNENHAEVRLRIYPGFEDRSLATTRPHAPAVKWLLFPLSPLDRTSKLQRN